MKTRVVRFGGHECVVGYSAYPNGRRAISLFDARDGSPFFTATVNVPETKLADGQTLIKDYSENHGILAALVDAGIVEPTGALIPVGHAAAHVVRVVHRQAA